MEGKAEMPSLFVKNKDKMTLFKKVTNAVVAFVYDLIMKRILRDGGGKNNMTTEKMPLYIIESTKPPAMLGRMV